MANPRIRIKRGFGIPIENDEILLSRGELAFDESENKLYIGKGLAENPISENPSQANELVIINSSNYITKTIENLYDDQEIILILYAKQNVSLISLNIFIETGSCNYILYKTNNESTDDITLLSESFVSDMDGIINNQFISQETLETEQKLYLKINTVNTGSQNLTVELVYN